MPASIPKKPLAQEPRLEPFTRTELGQANSALHRHGGLDYADLRTLHAASLGCGSSLANGLEEIAMGIQDVIDGMPARPASLERTVLETVAHRLKIVGPHVRALEDCYEIYRAQRREGVRPKASKEFHISMADDAAATTDDDALMAHVLYLITAKPNLAGAREVIELCRAKFAQAPAMSDPVPFWREGDECEAFFDDEWHAAHVVRLHDRGCDVRLPDGKFRIDVARIRRPAGMITEWRNAPSDPGSPRKFEIGASVLGPLGEKGMVLQFDPKDGTYLVRWTPVRELWEPANDLRLAPEEPAKPRRLFQGGDKVRMTGEEAGGEEGIFRAYVGENECVVEWPSGPCQEAVNCIEVVPTPVIKRDDRVRLRGDRYSDHGTVLVGSAHTGLVTVKWDSGGQKGHGATELELVPQEEEFSGFRVGDTVDLPNCEGDGNLGSVVRIERRADSAIIGVAWASHPLMVCPCEPAELVLKSRKENPDACEK